MRKMHSSTRSILCVLFLVVLSINAQDEFNKILGVAIDKGCMESVLFMPKACEPGGESDVRANAFFSKIKKSNHRRSELRRLC